MDWGAWQGIGTVASAVISLAALIYSIFSGRRASAAEKYASRLALANERMAESMERDEARRAEVAPPPQVAWSMRALGEKYELRNVGTGTAYGVRVRGAGAMGVGDQPGEAVDVAPGGVVTFWAMTAFVEDFTVTVTWADAEYIEPNKVWHRSLPPS